MNELVMELNFAQEQCLVELISSNSLAELWKYSEENNISLQARFPGSTMRLIDGAARKGNVEIFKNLLEGGVDIDTDQLPSVLHWALVCKDSSKRNELLSFIAKNELCKPFVESLVDEIKSILTQDDFPTEENIEQLLKSDAILLKDKIPPGVPSVLA